MRQGPSAERESKVITGDRQVLAKALLRKIYKEFVVKAS